MCTIVLSIKPEYVNKIFSEEKKFEFRRVVAKEHVDRILIYSTYPDMYVAAEVEVLDILSGSPEELWERTKNKAGIEYKRYMDYFQDRTKAFAYMLGDVEIFSSPKGLNDYGVKVPPQSFCYLKN